MPNFKRVLFGDELVAARGDKPKDVVQWRFRRGMRRQSQISEGEERDSARRGSEFRSERQSAQRSGNEKDGSPAHAPKKSSTRNVLFVFGTPHPEGPASDRPLCHASTRARPIQNAMAKR